MCTHHILRVYISVCYFLLRKFPEEEVSGQVYPVLPSQVGWGAVHLPEAVHSIWLDPSSLKPSLQEKWQVEPAVNSPWVSGQSRLPCSGADSSGHLMAGESNQECHNLQIDLAALFCTKFIHSHFQQILTTYWAPTVSGVLLGSRHFAMNTAGHEVQRAGGGMVGLQRGV